MRDCANRLSDPRQRGFCAGHWERLRTDRMFVPIRTQTNDEDGVRNECALCGTWVHIINRADETPSRVWALNAHAAPDGKCRIMEHGFVVVNPADAAALRAENVPLYRTHTSTCTARPT
jgi:hypothetical protein